MINLENLGAVYIYIYIYTHVTLNNNILGGEQ